MRYSLLLICLAISLMTCLISCSKKTNSPSGNGGPTSTGIASKYKVDTYVKGTSSLLNGPGQMCVDSKGVLYVSQTNQNDVIKIDPLLQTVAVFAGIPTQPGCAEDPLGSGAPTLTFPENLWASKDDQIFIGDYGCSKAKVASATGMVVSINFNNPNNLYPGEDGACEDYKGNIFIYGTNDGLYEVRQADQVLTSLVSGADLGIASSMTMDNAAQNVYLSAKHQVLEYTSGGLRSIAGNALGNSDGQGANASFGGSMVICMGGDGNIYVADTYNNSIRQVTPNGVVTTIAGDGNGGYVDGTGDKAEFYSPRGIAFATSGGNNVLYVSDYGNNLIRRITLPK